MNKYTIVILILIPVVQIQADEYHFKVTAEEIIEALMRQDAKQRTNENSRDTTPNTKTRGIVIVQEAEGEFVERSATVSADTPQQGVNLRIEFDFDSYKIRPDSFMLLQELGKALASPQIRGKEIEIKGHTDADGDSTYNLGLSIKRALAVKVYLVEQFKLTPSLLHTAGYGETMPIAPNTSKANKQLNRRVEVSLFDKNSYR